jgi:hypothetical protein
MRKVLPGTNTLVFLCPFVIYEEKVTSQHWILHLGKLPPYTQILDLDENGGLETH